MKKRNRFPYRQGSIVDIYADYQTCRNIEGVGRLIRFVSSGLPFILDETRKSDDQVVFSYQTWVVEIDGFTTCRKIRFVKGIGDYSSLDVEPYRSVEKDKFITINGKEVF